LDAHLKIVINALIEDTCVLVAVAYLLARGRMLSLLFNERLPLWKALYLGSVLGLVGVTEVAFPGARLPYATHTLIVTFAVLVGGLRVGFTAAGVVTLAAFILRPPYDALGMTFAVFGSALAAAVVGRLLRSRQRLATGFVAGILSQSYTVMVRALLLGSTGVRHPVIADPVQRFWGAIPSLAIPANGFGVLLLLLVVNDARIRASSERHRAEAERAHALVAEAELNALRARMHPHFLFNALTSIAALCMEAPQRAEAATVRLGQLMRRLLETRATVAISLNEELEQVRSYLEIEQLRLGGRMCVAWNIDTGSEQIRIPPFAIQTLVENAVQHGIAPVMDPGQISITVRRYRRHTLVAVRDNGAGMTAEARQRALVGKGERMHGLQILTQQLILLHHHRARLRLFSRVHAGTMAAFVVPNADKPLARK
jgi:LytS/YehU family sensor histidine kinase